MLVPVLSFFGRGHILDTTLLGALCQILVRFCSPTLSNPSILKGISLYLLFLPSFCFHWLKFYCCSFGVVRKDVVIHGPAQRVAATI